MVAKEGQIPYSSLDRKGPMGATLATPVSPHCWIGRNKNTAKLHIEMGRA